MKRLIFNNNYLKKSIYSPLNKSIYNNNCFNNNKRFYTTNNNNTPTTPTPTINNNDLLLESILKDGTDKTIGFNEFSKNFEFDPELIPITGLPSLLEVILNQLHQYTQWSWMVIVPAVTMVIRTSLFPLAVKTRLNAHRLLQIKPQLDKFKEISQYNRKNSISNFENSNKITELLREKKCHPLLTYILPLANLPFFISAVIAFREMAVTFPSFKTAGMLWFQDLSAYDPYYILPVTCSGLYILINELSIGKSDNFIFKALSWVSRGMAILIIPFAHTIPSMVYFYMIPSSLFSLLQVYLFQSKTFCKWVGMPVTQYSQVVSDQIKPQQQTQSTTIRYAPEIKKKKK
ncbi:putative oxidase assembly protein [Tieghemostelium lacteum]|uniref:Putative oxidase assembly protein n=1 Tax=Tieghemostelium lacteum TaxID=361077 RepID=A0A152AA79_TIELA|nr:putative oxidase assembly protein [Tieghemostelium lacteum]|eukprot:KYR03133.1 putative oxidase assembly protein [Tieghemostelium lacteum]